MAEFYNALRELPDLQSDLRFPTGRTKSFASQSSTFTPLHCERKSYASCMEMRDMALAPKGVPPARGSAVAGDEVWNNVDGDQVTWALQFSNDLQAVVGGCIVSGSAYSALAEVLRFMPSSTVSDRTRGRATRRPVAAAPDGGGAQAALDGAAGAAVVASAAEEAAAELVRFQAMLEGVDAAFEPEGGAGLVHEADDDDGDAAYADALYHYEPVAEARRRAAWEVQIGEEVQEATTCITERQCPICYEALGDDSSSGAICQLACGNGTHYFHAECLGRAWQAAGTHEQRCPLCRTINAGTPEASFVWTAVEANGEVQSQAAREAADAQAQAAWDHLEPATRNRDLDRADPAGDAVAGGWHAIDNHTVLECVVSPVGHLQDVPQSLRADWARANVDVFAEIERAQEAQDEVALERALKWYLVLHDVLLRGLQRGTRGSGRMANALATRFRLWREERRVELLQSWARDRARGWQRLAGRDNQRHDESEEDRARRAERVLELVRDGEISRAMRLLHSMGIAGVTEDVLSQMRRKHPPRQHSVPQQLPGPAAPAVAPMELTETFRALRRRAGTGVSGRRNEYLRALVGQFNDARADEVMARYSNFATAAMNVTFPPWFYSAWGISGLMPLIKSRLSPEQLRQGEQPDARPVAVGETDLRAILRNLTDSATAAAAEVLAPEQLAVGVSGGISVLIHGIRLILEVRRTFVCVRLDMSNGYNACSRSVLLRRLSEHAGLQHLVPPLHALGAEAPDLLIGAQRQRLYAGAQRGDSEEGTGQGQPHSSLAFCTCIQPELHALSQELEPFGGGARAIMDDVYVFGPAAQVFSAIERFVSALRRLTGLQINQGKSACFSRGYNLEGCPWRRRAGVPVGTVALTGVDGAAGPGTGIMVGGVPIGEPAFVTEVMRARVAGDVSYIETTVTQLRDQPHAAWAALFYSCAPRFDHWLRHMPPHETVQHAAVFDHAMLQAAEQLGYVGMLHDAFTRRRFHLPARMRGCGIRSRAWLAPIAFTACFVEAAEGMMGVTDAGLPALFEQLTDVFGVGAFAPGGTRFHAFLRDRADYQAPEAFLPTARAFADAWDALTRQALAGGGSGPLDVASGSAGAGRSAGAKLQRDMTAQLEQCRRDELHRDMMLLHQADPRRVAWLAVDRLSSQWVSSHPTHRVELNAAEFGETFTTYMGCESRLVRPYVGRSIPCGSRRHTMCDAYGHEVGLASLPGAPFTDCHDAIAHELWRILMEAGVRVDVEPRGIFTTLIPTPVLLQPGPAPGAVPDAAIDVALAAPATARNATAGARLPMQRWLFDVKTIFGGNGIYQCPRARDEQSGAVAERAHQVPREYLRAARQADQQYSAAGTNPILDRLRSFGQTRGLAFGAYGEASPDVHALLTVAADGLAARQWRDMGARTQEEARSFIVSSLRRRLGLVICREFARHRIRRVPYIGVPRAIVEQRMQRGQLIGGPQARVPLYVPYADFYQYQAGAGRLADRA